MPETAESNHPTPKSRWTRTRAIWALLILSLAPGIAASQFRDHWEDKLPPAVRVTAYAVSGLLIAAAFGLIVTAPTEPPRPRGGDSPPPEAR